VLPFNYELSDFEWLVDPVLVGCVIYLGADVVELAEELLVPVEGPIEVRVKVQGVQTAFIGEVAYCFLSEEHFGVRSVDN